MPVISAKPENAMIVVIVAEKTGGAILMAAFSAATMGFSPKLRALKSACSPTTMASSTTIPRVMIKANKEIILIVNPARYIIPIVAINAAGIPIVTQRAVRALRNRNNNPITKLRPIKPLSTSRLIRFVMCSARVLMSFILVPSGRYVSISDATFSTEL